MVYETEDLAFLPIRPNDDFARRLANNFGISDPDHLVKNTVYSNGEYCPTITAALSGEGRLERLSGRRACIVQSYTRSDLENTEAFARILLLTDAAYRAGAEEVYLVMAEHLFDRQDLDPVERRHDEFERFSPGKKRKIEKMQGQPFSLRVFVKHLHEAGIKRVVTLDGHSPAIDKVYARVYKCSPDRVLFNLDPVPVFVNYLLNLGIDLGEEGKNLVMVAPDRGARAAVEEFYELSGLTKAGLIFCNKYRTVANDPAKVEAEIEDKRNFDGIEGKIIVGMDDKGDTLGTLEKTLVRGLSGDGKPKQMHVLLSHMIFSSRGAYELIADNRLNVHGSNSHPNIEFKKDEPGVEHITVVDFTPYFAWALVNNVITGRPLPKPKKENLRTYAGLFQVVKKGKMVDF